MSDCELVREGREERRGERSEVKELLEFFIF